MLIEGDCLEVLPGLEAGSVDSVVTDPPYGLSFMGKDWDHGLPGEPFWLEVFRVMKPGAHLLAFGGTRTFHRLAVAIEDAGFEIRDCIMWVYGSGFPKSLDVSKAIDKAAGAEREVVGYTSRGSSVNTDFRGSGNGDITAPATEAARQWDGWGTSLKPAYETVIVARKPFKGTVAGNVLAYGTGAINVDGCRVGTGDNEPNARKDKHGKHKGELNAHDAVYSGSWRCKDMPWNGTQGRWPANLIHDGSDEATASMGQASRYFYCAKASKRDRDEGCEGLEAKDKYGPAGRWNSHDCFSGKSGDDAWKAKHPNLPKGNHHPTVKPTALMRYLCRLVTPPGGTVLDPFMGSGSTGKAAVLEGFDFIGIELNPEYVAIAEARIDAAKRQGNLC